MEAQRANSIEERIRMIPDSDMDKFYNGTLEASKTLDRPVCVVVFEDKDGDYVIDTSVDPAYSPCEEIMNILPVKAVEQIQLCSYKTSVPFLGVLKGGSDDTTSHFCVVNWVD